MTDQDILKRIVDESLVVDVNTATVMSYGTMLKPISRTHKEGKKRGTYRFINVSFLGKQKKIALHRLVWMAFHRKLIPDGYDIDHRELQTDDTIYNLRLLESGHNRSLGTQKAHSNRQSLQQQEDF
jgi:hypothetical protein